MKLYSKNAELMTLKVIMGGFKISDEMLARVRPVHFQTEAGKEAYQRMSALVRSGSKIPEFHELCDDPRLSETTREDLQALPDPVRKKSWCNALIATLDKYAKIRSLYHTAKSTIEALKKPSVDLDRLIEDNSNALLEARSRHSHEELMYHFGINNNTSKLIKSVINPEKMDYIPTGFDGYDEINGGFMRGSMVSIAANSGGGKSTVALNLLKNQAEMGYRVVLLPLEMTAREMTARLAANVSGIDVTRIILNKTSDEEKEKIKVAMIEWVKKVKAAGGTFTIYDAQEDITIEEFLFAIRPYGYDSILIDYISLLKGVNGEDSWRQLGNAARFAKVFAKNNNCVVTLLAQANEEGLIRYSRAVTEHSSNSWVWSMSERDMDKGFIIVRQMKARNQQKYDFTLWNNFSTMRLVSVAGNQADIFCHPDAVELLKYLDQYEEEVEEEEEIMIDEYGFERPSSYWDLDVVSRLEIISFEKECLAKGREDLLPYKRAFVPEHVHEEKREEMRRRKAEEANQREAEAREKKLNDE